MIVRRRKTRLTAALVAAGTLLAPPGWAQERGTKAVPERPARVYVMSAFDEACRPVAGMTLTVSTPPAQGEVTFRDNLPTTVMSSASGRCIGMRVVGTGVYYTARKGASGADQFAVTVRLADGTSSERRFRVMIADE
jgi:hypothetical protein